MHNSYRTHTHTHTQAHTHAYTYISICKRITGKFWKNVSLLSVVVGDTRQIAVWNRSYHNNPYLSSFKYSIIYSNILNE